MILVVAEGEKNISQILYSKFIHCPTSTPPCALKACHSAEVVRRGWVKYSTRSDSGWGCRGGGLSRSLLGWEMGGRWVWNKMSEEVGWVIHRAGVSGPGRLIRREDGSGTVSHREPSGCQNQ